MEQIIGKLKKDVQTAFKLVLNISGNRFHAKICESGSDMRTIPNQSMNSVQLGEYSSNKFVLNTVNVQKWINQAKSNPKWPDSVEYKNGVLFHVEHSEPEIIPEPEPIPEPVIEPEPIIEPEPVNEHDEFEPTEIEEPKPRKSRKSKKSK
jgi:hypothetical protein